MNSKGWMHFSGGVGVLMCLLAIDGFVAGRIAVGLFDLFLAYLNLAQAIKMSRMFDQQDKELS
jgi:hypothetical protein